MGFPGAQGHTGEGEREREGQEGEGTEHTTWSFRSWSGSWWSPRKLHSDLVLTLVERHLLYIRYLLKQRERERAANLFLIFRFVRCK